MTKKGLSLYLLFAVFIFSLPLYLANEYYVSLLIIVGINVLAALGIVLLTGFAGQLSLCQAAFYGIGAYTTGVLSAKFGFNPWISLVLGVLMACCLAYLLGLPALKLKGHYLAMATLGFGEIVNIVFKEWGSLTGGPSGLVGIPQLALGGFTLDTDLRYYMLVWCIVMLVLAFLINLTNSRIGRGLLSIKRSEDAAASLGVSVATYKIKVFMLCAALGALGGGLYAHYITVISPEAFDVFYSIILIIMAVCGGLTYIWGGVIGASLFTIIPEALQAVDDYSVIAYGFILLFILMFMPQGIAGLLDAGIKQAKGVFWQKWRPLETQGVGRIDTTSRDVE
jgi:branched-chain amino acid transport system permease protein